MAQRFYVQIVFADNDGMIISGPLATGQKSSSARTVHVIRDLDPTEIGKAFLAFYTDIKLEGKMPIDLDNIEF
jgi:hypothetical protein